MARQKYLIGLRDNRRDAEYIARIICEVVPFIETLAANLPHRDGLHYGTEDKIGILDNVRRNR